MKLSKITVLGLLVGVSGLVGCHETDQSGMNQFFGPEDHSRRVHQALDSQANCGARDDATLYAMHFTGGKLNSLGAAKLARVVPDEADTAVQLYLDMPENDLTAPRKEAVTTYLRACGVNDAQLTLAVGSNPNVTTPSAPGITHLPRTETGATAGEGDAAAGSGAPSYAPQTSTGLQQ